MSGKVFTCKAAALPCSVLDMSERGARLLFVDAAPRHDNLLLVIEELGQVRSGAIRWRNGTTAGIEFRRDPDDLLE